MRVLLGQLGVARALRPACRRGACRCTRRRGPRRARSPSSCCPDVRVLLLVARLGEVGGAVEHDEAALGGALARTTPLGRVPMTREGADLLDDLGGVLARALTAAAERLAVALPNCDSYSIDLDLAPVELEVLVEVLDELVADGVGLLGGGEAAGLELLVCVVWRVGRLREVPEDDLDRVRGDARDVAPPLSPVNSGSARQRVRRGRGAAGGPSCTRARRGSCRCRPRCRRVAGRHEPPASSARRRRRRPRQRPRRWRASSSSSSSPTAHGWEHASRDHHGGGDCVEDAVALQVLGGATRADPRRRSPPHPPGDLPETHVPTLAMSSRSTTFRVGAPAWQTPVHAHARGHRAAHRSRRHVRGRDRGRRRRPDKVYKERMQLARARCSSSAPRAATSRSTSSTATAASGFGHVRPARQRRRRRRSRERHGFAHGDRLAVLSANNPEWVPLVLGDDQPRRRPRRPQRLVEGRRDPLRAAGLRARACSSPTRVASSGSRTSSTTSPSSRRCTSSTPTRPTTATTRASTASASSCRSSDVVPTVDRRGRLRGDLLHVGHDRPAEGRDQLAPLDDRQPAEHDVQRGRRRHARWRRGAQHRGARRRADGVAADLADVPRVGLPLRDRRRA